MKSAARLFIVTISILIQIPVFAQYQEIESPNNIQTVQLFNPQTNDHTPIIKLGSDYLILSFDDFRINFTQYSYSIEHYNADWTPSGIFESEYINGFSSQYIQDYKYSFNTYNKYTHYQVKIPNSDMGIKVSGNYVIKVYLKDPDKPILTKRFAVYEDNASIGLKIDRNIGNKNPDLNQRVYATIGSAKTNLTEAPNAAKLFVMKNNNWNDNLGDISPQFSQTSQLTYNAPTLVFEGNNEYNWFDTKNLLSPALTTETTYRKDSVYYTQLRVEAPQKDFPYSQWTDINGGYYIRNASLLDETLAGYQADYGWVQFRLQDFDDQNGKLEVYVVGAFNNFEISPKYEMTKNNDGIFELQLFLKQGYYNYQFAVRNVSDNYVSLSAVNGSYWQTENLYQGLFYYRPWGVRYDKLLGYGEAYSR